MILGNSNVLLASNLRRSVRSGGFCGGEWHFILLICLTRELTYRLLFTLIDWFTCLMPCVHFIKTFDV